MRGAVLQRAERPHGVEARLGVGVAKRLRERGNRRGIAEAAKREREVAANARVLVARIREETDHLGRERGIARFLGRRREPARELERGLPALARASRANLDEEVARRLLLEHDDAEEEVDERTEQHDEERPQEELKNDAARRRRLRSGIFRRRGRCGLGGRSGWVFVRAVDGRVQQHRTLAGRRINSNAQFAIGGAASRVIRAEAVRSRAVA